MAACACPSVTPSRRRAFTVNAASSGRRSSARDGAPMAGSDEIGSQKSVTMPRSIVARCPAGPTPTIVTGTLSIRMVRPTIEGVDPNFRRHASCPSTATTGAPGTSSAAVNQRPSGRLEAEHRQIGRRRVFGDGRPQDAIVQVVHAVRHEGRGGAREDVGVRGHVEVGRVGIAVDAAAVGAVLVEVDQPIRFGEGLPAEQRRVDEAEDGGVGADAEAQDGHGRRGETPVADEAPDRVTGVARQAVEAGRPPRVAAHAPWPIRPRRSGAGPAAVPRRASGRPPAGARSRDRCAAAAPRASPPRAGGEAAARWSGRGGCARAARPYVLASTRLTPADSRSHFDSSVATCFRPAFVSE